MLIPKAPGTPGPKAAAGLGRGRPSGEPKNTFGADAGANDVCGSGSSSSSSRVYAVLSVAIIGCNRI